MSRHLEPNVRLSQPMPIVEDAAAKRHFSIAEAIWKLLRERREREFARSGEQS